MTEKAEKTRTDKELKSVVQATIPISKRNIIDKRIKDLGIHSQAEYIRNLIDADLENSNNKHVYDINTVNDYKSQIDQLKDQLKDIKETVSVKDDDISKLKTAKHTIRLELTNMTNELSIKKSECDSLSENIKDLTHKSNEQIVKIQELTMKGETIKLLTSENADQCSKIKELEQNVEVYTDFISSSIQIIFRPKLKHVFIILGHLFNRRNLDELSTESIRELLTKYVPKDK